MAAKFGSSSLNSIVKFGDNKIRKITFGISEILKTTGTKSAAYLSDYFSNWDFAHDMIPNVISVEVVFGTPTIDIDRLTVTYPAGTINVVYEFRQGGSYTGEIQAASVDDLVAKDGIKDHTLWLHFPALPSSTYRYSIDQPSSTNFYIKFSSYSAMENFINLTTSWKV